MDLLPAIDLYEGKVVRLERGDFEKCTVYSDNPAEMAEQWVSKGARWLHVVDLEGARDGEIKNWNAIEEILSTQSAAVQFGGGVRSLTDIKRLLEMRIQRVVLGTKALDEDFLAKAVSLFKNRIALSLDIRRGEIQTEGWMKASGVTLYDAFSRLAKYELACLVVTDIEHDGLMQGINEAHIKKTLDASPHPVIIAGGVSSLEHLKALVRLSKNKRLQGVILGKGLYEGKIRLEEALNLARGG